MLGGSEVGGMAKVKNGCRVYLVDTFNLEMSTKD
jgi:hypothetical protein